MAHRPRSEMIAETRAKLLAAARHAFGTKGYAEASMDDFTAEAGLTRGALYHHFGDKKGLLQAVVAEIDAEMNARAQQLSRGAADPWRGFVVENTGYLEMALEPEIQRILLRDGPAVLGDPSTWPSQGECVRSMTGTLQRLAADGVIVPVPAEATARLLNGAVLQAALWIANAPDPVTAAKAAVEALEALLHGLLRRPEGRGDEGRDPGVVSPSTTGRDR